MKSAIVITCFLAMSLLSCTTTMELKTLEKKQVEKIDEPEIKTVVYQEKEVIVNQPVYEPPQDKKSETKVNGKDAVKSSMEESKKEPQYWKGGMMFYDYDKSFSYNIYTQPLRMTDIELEPGEAIMGNLVCADSTRWIIMTGVSQENDYVIQHIYIKPIDSGLDTTLIINTDKRRYYLVLKSYADAYMMGVKWKYPIFQVPTGSSTGSTGPSRKKDINIGNVSLEYNVEFTNAKSAFIPKYVIDDGSKTYIVLSEGIKNDKLPAVLGQDGELVNFRIQENTIIIDKLIKYIMLKIENDSVVIRKKEK
jgi:type IV secretion system protein TrbG